MFLKKKQVEQSRDAIFIVVEEKSCPLYIVGDEIKVENFGISISSFKPSCLSLAEEVATVVTSKENLKGFSIRPGQKTRFECGGCDESKISFMYKKEKDFATTQMKLLEAAEEKKRNKHIAQFFGVLRKLSLFDPLDDDALRDLTPLLEFKTIPIGKVIIKQNSRGTHLYIILQGRVEMKGEDGKKLTEFNDGEIFGEMSLLSGEPIANTYVAITATRAAMLSVKNFKHILKQFPVLQLFIFKMLIDRAQTTALKSGNISSGMTGELSEIAPVDLFQLINSSRKTGVIDLSLPKGRAMVFFNNGEIVYARYLDHRNKAAVYALMGMTSGSFSYKKGIPKELDEQPPIGTFMSLMMEGVQNLDES